MAQVNERRRILWKGHRADIKVESYMETHEAACANGRMGMYGIESESNRIEPRQTGFPIPKRLGSGKPPSEHHLVIRLHRSNPATECVALQVKRPYPEGQHL